MPLSAASSTASSSGRLARDRRGQRLLQQRRPSPRPLEPAAHVQEPPGQPAGHAVGHDARQRRQLQDQRVQRRRQRPEPGPSPSPSSRPLRPWSAAPGPSRSASCRWTGDRGTRAPPARRASRSRAGRPAVAGSRRADSTRGLPDRQRPRPASGTGAEATWMLAWATRARTRGASSAARTALGGLLAQARGDHPPQARQSLGALGVAAQPEQVVGHAAGQVAAPAGQRDLLGRRRQQAEGRHRPAAGHPGVLAAPAALDGHLQGLGRGREAGQPAGHDHVAVVGPDQEGAQHPVPRQELRR